MGTEFAAANAVGMGVQAQYLDQYARRADELFLADRAADVVGLNIGVSQFVNQLPEWRAYCDQPVSAPSRRQSLLPPAWSSRPLKKKTSRSRMSSNRSRICWPTRATNWHQATRRRRDW
ncbi:hypothetical protein E6W36_02215 [Hankyongella ginsenosidimutans]|uniref:Uncharacterized protein n=1 Tax=Hankyongella ginsenosidimutans TaxID=1763828 RepID=A0A4D7C710_9SPHN|nr:hypothetical protein [Hankyongella ginsenosidimutans]QCI78848.1 hypothetical protein E6W36_02215 [Hankyongella ginsenosidimutans]